MAFSCSSPAERAVSSPQRAAAVPEMRLSPVRGLMSWKRAPLAKEPGWAPE